MSGISPTNAKFSPEERSLPAGKYLAVDPCYVIGEDPFWSTLCEYSFPEGQESRKNFYIELDPNNTAFSFFTAFGDGRYPVSDDETHEFTGVDSGCLSLIPLDYIQEHNLDQNSGVIVTLKKASVPTVDDGNLKCGDIYISTNDFDEEYFLS